MDIVDTILHGDALAMLRTLPDGCVQCCVTSPPYWGLRDYGVPGQLGLEATPDEYVARMVEVFAEVKRVLRDDGTLWLNLGDSYAREAGDDSRKATDTGMRTGRTGKSKQLFKAGCNRPPTGLKPKDLIGIPWMVAFALRSDGWWLRSDIVWHKPNPMPESVRDRPTRSHEYLFLLSKRERYFYDADAIREPHTALGRPPGNKSRIYFDRDPQHHSGEKRRPEDAHSFHALGRNKRDVWTVATAPFPGSHFAVFPPALIEPCVLAGTSPRACETCGAPWVRVVKREPTPDHIKAQFEANRARSADPHGRSDGHVGTHKPNYTRAILGESWRPTCRCLHNTGAGHSLVLDPFMGAGTVGVVARRHSRHYLGIELNQTYIELANDRIAREVQPVLWTA